MSTSLREGILERVVAVLQAGATGSTIFRSRQEAIARSAAPATVIEPKEEQDEQLGTGVDRHTLFVTVEIYVRGDPFDQVADPIAVATHLAILQDATLRGMADVRKVGSVWAAHEADRSAGVVEMTYRFVYVSSVRDISTIGIG